MFYLKFSIKKEYLEDLEKYRQELINFYFHSPGQLVSREEDIEKLWHHQCLISIFRIESSIHVVDTLRKLAKTNSRPIIDMLRVEENEEEFFILEEKYKTLEIVQPESLMYMNSSFHLKTSWPANTKIVHNPNLFKYPSIQRIGRVDFGKFPLTISTNDIVN